jgi:hypothetical protein
MAIARELPDIEAVTLRKLGKLTMERITKFAEHFALERGHYLQRLRIICENEGPIETVVIAKLAGMVGDLKIQ